jgi:hypothetical protein
MLRKNGRVGIWSEFFKFWITFSFTEYFQAFHLHHVRSVDAVLRDVFLRLPIIVWILVPISQLLLIALSM